LLEGNREGEKIALLEELKTKQKLERGIMLQKRKKIQLF